MWKSYFASRLAWVDEALAVRRGAEWSARETDRERIESPEWIEIDDVIGRVTCFRARPAVPSPRGAELARYAAARRRRRATAISIRHWARYESSHRTRRSACSRAGQPCIAELPGAQAAPRGWFVHVGAKTCLLTHVEPLAAPADGSSSAAARNRGPRNPHEPQPRSGRSDRRASPIFAATRLEVLSVVEAPPNSTSARIAGCKSKRNGEIVEGRGSESREPAITAQRHGT